MRYSTRCEISRIHMISSNNSNNLFSTIEQLLHVLCHIFTWFSMVHQIIPGNMSRMQALSKAVDASQCRIDKLQTNLTTQTPASTPSACRREMRRGLRACCRLIGWSCWWTCSSCLRTEREGRGFSSPGYPVSAGSLASHAGCWRWTWATLS